MPSSTKEIIRQRLQKKIHAGQFILGCGAGIGLTAKSVEKIADFIVIYNSGRFRMAGCGSLAGQLPYGDANAIMLEMAAEVLPRINNIPVIAGVCGTDPFRQMPVFLNQLKELGFAGVQNFPTVGLYDGVFRQNLEETGMSYDLEVEMIRTASKMGFITCPYVFNTEEAKKMVEAGADIIVAHMGLTTKGVIGAKTSLTLEESAKRVQAIADAAHKINKNIFVVCHGGPIAGPEDVAYVLKNTYGVVGFWGASSIERLPVERAITQQAEKFKQVLSTNKTNLTEFISNYSSRFRAKL